MKKEVSVVILDYGVGNLYSLQKALNYIGVQAHISASADALQGATHIVLPGVGSFQAGMKGLYERALVDPLKKYATENKPILGICLGAQLLLSKGYEFGECDGLNIIAGKVIPFSSLADNEKIPHIGWNGIYPTHDTIWHDGICSDVSTASQYYFVHSYIMQLAQLEDQYALASYGGCEFCAIVRHGNMYGCQFHPEKSGEAGLEFIRNFITIR